MANLADGYLDDCSSDGIVFSAAPDGSAWAATGRNGAACAPPFGLMYRYGPAAGWQQLPPPEQTRLVRLLIERVDYDGHAEQLAIALRPGGRERLAQEELAEIGIQLIVCPLTALFGAAKAMKDLLFHLRKMGTTRDRLDQLLLFDQFHQFVDLNGHYALDGKYGTQDGTNETAEK